MSAKRESPSSSANSAREPTVTVYVKLLEAAGFVMAASPAELGTTLQEAIKRGPPKKR